MEIPITYLQLGFFHVIPQGFDHVLFILALFLGSNSFKTMAQQGAIFTVAHSFSLGLTSFGLLMPNPPLIEVLIAGSIVYTALDNILNSRLAATRHLVVFCFGLIHGMGFANALTAFGLPKHHYLSALFFFNIGVEIGQILILVLAYLILFKHFGNKIWYKDRVVYPISCIIGCIALYWTISRLFV